LGSPRKIRGTPNRLAVLPYQAQLQVACQGGLWFSVEILELLLYSIILAITFRMLRLWGMSDRDRTFSLENRRKRS
jgi:hypothetical protein